MCLFVVVFGGVGVGVVGGIGCYFGLGVGMVGCGGGLVCFGVVWCGFVFEFGLW